ncbi:MAG: metallophosphoesterase [Candidatus Riflebacteria bacterium]|nr:metallophosphoesterase [Candidatus Riflebacteria bacterium]
MKKYLVLFSLIFIIVFSGTIFGANITFLTDIEGNQAKLINFFKSNPAFAQDSDGKYHLKADFIFVHGGDICDRFPGERLVMREFLRLKQETPDRVILIAGNRDINKIRIPVELSDSAIKTDPIFKSDDFHQWIQGKNLPNNRSNRLKWILERTMGSPSAFELRRSELASENGVNPAAISDDQVTGSYLSDTTPGGLLFRILKSSVIMAHVGKTLFVHSGICSQSLGKIPGSLHRKISIVKWETNLNEWFQKSLTDWQQNLGHKNIFEYPVGYELVQYVGPAPKLTINPESVVYGREVDQEGKVALPPEDVINFLKENGFFRLVLGHTPSGQFPVIERLPDQSFEMVVGDTSYSPRTDEAPHIFFTGPDERTTTIQGQISFDEKMVVPISFSIEAGEKTIIGSHLPSNAVVIAPFKDGYLTYRLLPGFKVQYDYFKP